MVGNNFDGWKYIFWLSEVTLTVGSIFFWWLEVTLMVGSNPNPNPKRYFQPFTEKISAAALGRVEGGGEGILSAAPG